MIELSRFQQLRPVQKISDEEKQQVGLPLYPDADLSQLAQSLLEAKTDRVYLELINRHIDVNGQKPITDVKSLNPVIASLYNWVSFKARPIRLDDFKSFVAGLDPAALPKLEDEWRRYADQLVIAIVHKLLPTNFCVDFQLLIRICYLIRVCLQVNEAQKYELTGRATAELINLILDLAVVLPPSILHGRCREDCAQASRMEIPTGQNVTQIIVRDPCKCECDKTCQNPSHFCICIRPYIGDLFLIREELARFEEGDIADIENILAGEKKVRRHRTLLHSETTTETDTETTTSEERDHQVEEKFSLQSEVKNTVDQKVNVDAGVTATLKYGDSVTITPHANVVANFSKSESENIARSYSKDVVDRAVSKIEEKVRKVQISKVINEIEEKNEHSIDNTQLGADHRAGIYYWVNKVSHAQVYNYGRHMMFDVIVPEPAAIFKTLYASKLQADAKPPEKPAITPQSIQRDTYGALLSQYGIATTDEIQPPDPTVCVQIAFSQNVSETDPNKTAAFSSNDFKADIPKGYKAASMDYDIRVSTGHPGGTDPDDEVAVTVNVGDACLLTKWMNEFAQGGGQQNQNWVSPQNHLPMKGEQGSVTVAVAGFSTMALSLSGSISITCDLTQEALEKWQTQIYNLVMADYNRKLDAYNSSNNKSDQLVQIKGRNPFLNREIERNEFKRNIIALLMCNYFNGIGSMMERVSPCGYPEPNFEKLAQDAPVIQFFEQVFEWEYVTYVFYHSMWARKCKWPDLIDEDSGDPLFDKFLMSGAARVQVPIRPGMEDVFNWFLKTGQIWGATGKPPVPGDDDYIAMIQELKEADQCDYNDRPGLIEAVHGSDVLTLTNSTFYWDLVNDQLNTLNVNNDIDRELLVNFKIYRIVSVDQATLGDDSTWKITIDKPYPDASQKNMKHAVGALFVGAPWEVVIPTELVYLRNPKDKLPTYPLS